VVICGTVIIFALRINKSVGNDGNKPLQNAARFTSIGYAVPGTVLAIGVLVPLAYFDRGIGAVFEWLEMDFRGFFSGTLTALFFAYIVRFMAIATGSIESGFERLSVNIDHAARTLGQTEINVLRKVHLPLLKPALGAALLLIFVDVMKELPATLLLRPFNFDTLATHTYTYASLDLFKESAPAALLIVLVGLIPILLLDRMISNGRPGV